MTCIIALRDKETGTVYLAGDKLGSNGSTKAIYKDPKIFQIGHFYFGYTTSFYMGQLLKYVWKQPCKTMHQDEDEYLFQDVVYSLKKVFTENKFGKDQNGHEPDFGQFIMVYKGRIFKVQDNMSLLESEDFVSVGCGEHHAAGAVEALVSHANMSTPDILKESIKIVSKFSCGVSEECDIIKCV